METANHYTTTDLQSPNNCFVSLKGNELITAYRPGSCSFLAFKKKAPRVHKYGLTLLEGQRYNIVQYDYIKFSLSVPYLSKHKIWIYVAFLQQTKVEMWN